MLSFYQRLASKLNEGGGADAQAGGQPPVQAAAPTGAVTPSKGVSYNAAGNKLTPTTPAAPTAAQAAAEAPPEGTEPLGVDLFESESRMIVYVQAPGVGPEDFEITADEESNTIVLQTTQKRPALPPVPGVKEADAPEKGRFIKQEVKWATLYRKIYLPESFDSGEAEVSLSRGILTLMLPAKRPGAGRKLVVHETTDGKNEIKPKA
jgi:HSP20 family molecular chaperone IbpA